MANVNMANREVCNLVFVDYTTNKPFLNVDYANVSTAGLTGEQVFAYGGWGHPKRITFYGEKGGTIGFETQIAPFKLYSMMTGAEVQNTANWLKRVEVVAASTSELTVEGVTANSEVNVFKADDDCGTEVTATAGAGKLTGTFVNGTKYVVYFTEALSDVQRLNITNATFPQYFKAYMETKDKTENGKEALFRMVAYKCAPQAEFSLEFSNTGDPATLSVTCDLMIDDDDNLLDMILMPEA